ncbi:hypothetical protein MSG28_010627 [Choristoneura fumiferana]|uniref:Uncharacterized protein n=1 Tax=Choristoneura fumiferana TaxID=7141 RepID=A0ACC0KNN2_CHOFU|nr:hypothetical protein MSG28_010627 [Choristoneura fumiferana]
MTIQDVYVRSNRRITEEPKVEVISGSVMDNMEVDIVTQKTTYKVYKIRWLMLALFVLYSASNSMQWVQYTIINDIVVNYYGVPSTFVSWTSMVYMVTYVPLIVPASWLLDKTLPMISDFLEELLLKEPLAFSENKIVFVLRYVCISWS